MRPHPPIVHGLAAALKEIFVENRHAEKVVDNYLKSNKKWGSRDRRQFAETLYNIVRWWRLLIEGAKSDSPSDVLEFYLSDGAGWIANREEKKFAFKLRESYPDLLYEIFCTELSLEKAEKYLLKMNEPAPIYLRANTLKITASQLKEKLETEGVLAEMVEDCVLRLKERKNVFITEAYKNGFFEMQDRGSQHIAPLLQVKPGERVVDACAGAGGKTLHMAALMANKGRILSLDIHEWKLKELQKRARRGGVHIVETKCIESTKVIKRLEGSADALLLDVPCSGVGVLRRHPDTKWKFNEQSFAEVQQTQKDILQQYTNMLKPGGRLVYATCSLLPSENADQIRSFMAHSPGAYEIEEELFVSPIETDSDGYYAARLVKKK